MMTILSAQSALEIDVILSRIMISAATILFSVAIGFSALLYLAQDHLIFLQQPAPAAPPRAANLKISEVDIASADGVALRGWMARPVASGSARLPLVIYFGGNAEEVSHMATLASHFPGWSLLAVNYRGYGGNAGKPSERAFFADALAVYDWAASRADVVPERMVAIGRSIGSGVAVYLAAKRPLCGVVLVTPYDSLRAVAQRHYPYLPVALLLKHPFDSLSRAPHISTPLLVIAAQRDSIVPPEHARALFAKWGGPKTWRERQGAGHNNLDADPGYWNAIAGFLADR